MLLLCAIVASLLTQRAVGASAVEAVVVGDGALGANNATADFAAVLGGQFNTASGLHSLVAGGLNNSASNTFSAILGGSGNSVPSAYATVVGGNSNSAVGAYSFVGGGGAQRSELFNSSAFALDNGGNIASGNWSVVVAGRGNAAEDFMAIVTGGDSNTAAGIHSGIAGGRSNRANDTAAYAAIGGGLGNQVAGFGAVVSGGGGRLLSSASSLGPANFSGGNEALSDFATVSGGHANSAAAEFSVVSGGASNFVNTTAKYGTVAGGFGNEVNGYAATVGGGGGLDPFSTLSGNKASASWTVVAGGVGNTALGLYATIGGGYGNTVKTEGSSVLGGKWHLVTGYFGAIGGGSLNTVRSDWSTVGGGFLNRADAAFTSVGGGVGNTASNFAGRVGGGSGNRAGVGDDAGDIAYVGGGRDNTAKGYGSSVVGGENNVALEQYAAIAGGNANTVSGSSYAAFVGGGESNTASASFALVAGGSSNTARGEAAVVAGGDRNRATAVNSVVVGGERNAATGYGAFVSGGLVNKAAGYASAVGGGSDNTAQADFAYVGGGELNLASARATSVCGGSGNSASAPYASVLGGHDNTASGEASLAAGTNAVASESYSAVLGFSAAESSCTSEGAGTVSICVENGLFLNGRRMNATEDIEAAVLSSEIVLGLLDDVDQLESTVAAQQLHIDALETNATVQDLVIQQLQSEVAVLSANMTSLLAAVEALVQAANFAPTTLDTVAPESTVAVTDCNDDSVGVAPCTQTTAQLATTSAVALTTAEAPTTTLVPNRSHAPATTPVNNAFTSAEPPLATASTDSTGSAASLPPTTIGTAAAATSSLASSSQATASPTAATTDSPSTVPTVPSTTIPRTTSISTTTTTTPLPPPTIDSIRLHFVAGTSLLNRFNMSVVATPSQEAPASSLTYQYTVVAVSTATDGDTGAGSGSGFSNSAPVSSYQLAAQGPFIEFEVPATRSFHVQVSVLQQTADGGPSSVAKCRLPTAAPSGGDEIVCPLAAARDGPVDDATDILDDVLNYNFTGNQSAGGVVFLSGIDALGASEPASNASAAPLVTTTASTPGANVTAASAAVPVSNLAVLAASFLDYVQGGGNADGVDQNTVVLSAFMDAFASSGESDSALSATLLDVITEISSGLGTADTDTLTLFLDVVDRYATATGAVNNEDVETLETLDAATAAVCAADASAVAYNQSSFALSCLEGTGDREVVSTGPGGAVVVATLSTGDVVAVTSWRATSTGGGGGGAAGETTLLLATVQGVTLAVADEATRESLARGVDDIDFGVLIAIPLDEMAATDEPLRRSLSCSYWDSAASDWTTRGVFLRGIALKPSSTTTEAVVRVTALCVSSHLTLFSTVDDSAAAALVDGQVQRFADRLETLGTVDLLDGDTTINYLVPMLFGLCTAAFVVVAVSARACGGSEAVDEARRVFVQDGGLTRPGVLRAPEFEAIIRNWLPCGAALRLLVLDVAASNPFLTLLFRWSHEHLVYTQADKAIVLYASVLSTFLVQAFLFEPTEVEGALAGNVTATTLSGGEASAQPSGDLHWLSGVLLTVFIGALIANLVLFPVKYFLPFMIANVNSFSTSTPVAKGILQRQLESLNTRLCLPCEARRTMTLAADHVASGSGDVSAQADAKKQKRQLKRRLSKQQRENAANVTAAKVLNIWSSTVLASSLDKTTRDAQLSSHSGGGGGAATPPPEDGAAADDGDDDADMLSRAALASQAQKRLERQLWFLNCSVPLPKVRDFAWRDSPHGQRNDKDTDVENPVPLQTTTTTTTTLSSEEEALVARFQIRVRSQQRVRRVLRSVEFDAWLHECRSWRSRLVAINGVFLATLAMATLLVCLFLSAAFTAHECVLWVVAVAQSLAMQLLVTDPLISMVVLAFKLVASWALLRTDRKAREAALLARWDLREAMLARREKNALAEVRQLASAMASTGASPDAMAVAARLSAKAKAVEALLTVIREERSALEKERRMLKERRAEHLLMLENSASVRRSRKSAAAPTPAANAKKKKKKQAGSGTGSAAAASPSPAASSSSSGVPRSNIVPVSPASSPAERSKRQGTARRRVGARARSPSPPELEGVKPGGSADLVGDNANPDESTGASWVQHAAETRAVGTEGQATGTAAGASQRSGSGHSRSGSGRSRSSSGSRDHSQKPRGSRRRSRSGSRTHGRGKPSERRSRDRSRSSKGRRRSRSFSGSSEDETGQLSGF